MDERMHFVSRWLAGETMAELCREFGISRKTGYKIFDRYQECGIQGLFALQSGSNRLGFRRPFQILSADSGCYCLSWRLPKNETVNPGSRFPRSCGRHRAE
jgi:hypothetical protein